MAILTIIRVIVFLRLVVPFLAYPMTYGQIEIIIFLEIFLDVSKYFETIKKWFPTGGASPLREAPDSFKVGMQLFSKFLLQIQIQKVKSNNSI